jgi:predicted TIM-barrel enzyme
MYRRAMCRGLSNNALLLNLLENSRQDAVLAAEAGVDGILLSNHGGACTIPDCIQVCDVVFLRAAIRLVRI